MKTFTRSDVLSWRPCYGKTKTLRIMRGLPRKMTALDVLRHEAATPAYRLWCVLRSDVLSERTLRIFAAWCARTALDAERAAGREPDVRLWAAVEIAEHYAVGRSTEDELRAAHVDAVDAYNAARATRATRAARVATDAAAYDATNTNTTYAARAAADAADYAARAVATVAAYDATRAAQVARLVELIEENEK